MQETNVLAEIRAVRDELAKLHGGDAWVLSNALVEKSKLAGRVLVRFPPRMPQPKSSMFTPLVGSKLTESEDVPAS
jgi:hypothetical protein